MSDYKETSRSLFYVKNIRDSEGVYWYKNTVNELYKVTHVKQQKKGGLLWIGQGQEGLQA